jgi:hypothetical protein
LIETHPTGRDSMNDKYVKV